MASSTPDQDELYAVLRDWAVRVKNFDTYTALSQAYKTRTGDWFEPHGNWDVPLGMLNRHVHTTIQAPAISALVVLRESGEPGGKFWGCAPNVPARPRSAITRTVEWGRILHLVLRFNWPNSYP